MTVALGTTLAFVLLDSPGDLFATAYGRALTVKVAIVVVALALAVAARRRGLPAEGHRIVTLAVVTRAEVVAVAGVVAASAVLASTGPPAGGERYVLGPAPLPAGAVWSADLAGSHLVEVGAPPAACSYGFSPPAGSHPSTPMSR